MNIYQICTEKLVYTFSSHTIILQDNDYLRSKMINHFRLFKEQFIANVRQKKMKTFKTMSHTSHAKSLDTRIWS